MDMKRVNLTDTRQNEKHLAMLILKTKGSTEKDVIRAIAILLEHGWSARMIRATARKSVLKEFDSFFPIPLTDTEIRALKSLQLRGCIGSMGSLTVAQRSDMLQGLLKRGYITDRLVVTKKALNELRFN